MSKTLNVLKKTLEYLWLIIALGSIGIGIKEHISNTYKEALPFYLFTFIALFFFSSRRKNRMSPPKNDA
ncbi:MAG: hypothetical protein JEZ09_10995 [Salinivirgaceae bacterium]|nr:hypothetical protein [Salinivirgaceae bacterium]